VDRVDAKDPPEETLDPADWGAFRALAHRMVDDTLDHLASLRDRPAWQPMPPASATASTSPCRAVGKGRRRRTRSSASESSPIPTATCTRASGGGCKATARRWG
jgi:aromatic-L-amino-acid decarboxylase